MRSELAAGGLILALALPLQGGVVDDFTSVDDWVAAPSDGVGLRIATDRGVEGSAMRLDFDFHGGAGYAIARKALATPLDEDFELSFHLRGDTPPNTLEIKLIDPSGESVWWVNRRNMTFPSEWTPVRLRRRHFEFAWGPSQGAPLEAISAIEIVVTASTGGKGTVWVDELRLDALEPRPAVYPPVRARSLGGRSAPALVDGDLESVWTAPSARSGLLLDFGTRRELGGLTLHWTEEHHAIDYDVETSIDGSQWIRAAEVRESRGSDDPIFMPDADARFIRIQLLRGASGTVGLREITIEPLEISESRSTFFTALASRQARGLYPRYFQGEQSYWTIVGEPGGEREVLINTDGAIESDAGGFSLEPFLFSGNRLVTWNDARSSQSLADSELPVPTVEWRAPPGVPDLSVTAFSHDGATYARYRLHNRGSTSLQSRLFLALRPFQVNPPWQFLNVVGGVSRIERIRRDGNIIDVDGKRVVAVTPMDDFGGSTFASGDVTELLTRGALPDAVVIDDSFGAASAALQWNVTLDAGASRDIWIMLPDGAAVESIPDVATAEAHLSATVDAWRSRLSRFELSLPGDADRISEVINSNVAYILINQDGGAIQPGSRSYDRSWIRDGSLTSAALLRLGFVDPVRSFIDWIAPFQFPSGKVPCCVDFRGADPVPEHDSSGQLIYLLAEYYRHTKDIAVLERHWPRVRLAVGWLESLIAERSTPEYTVGDKRAYYGLVPESISHEGYSAKPMHSYWDDFFTLKGLEDATEIAAVLGHRAEAEEYREVASTFRTNLFASIDASRRMHSIDFIPGSVELGDFDATSTTIALAPGGLAGELDESALRATFDRYWAESQRRMQSDTWDAYTPYETRTIGSFVRLDQRERALAMLEWLMRDLRPQGWNHWAEVVFRDPATPRFIGDMPHTWVGSDFIRSVLDMFAYEEGDTLVVAHGIPDEWTRGDGASLRGLRTHFGLLDIAMRREGELLMIDIGGSARPPGGLVLRADAPWASTAEVNGAPVPVAPGGIFVPALPARVILRP